MYKLVNRKEQTRKRHQRVRLKISGDSQWPRLAVYRSTKHIYAQIIDDTKGITLVSSSSKVKELGLKHGGNIESAKVVGADIAKKALEKSIKQVVCDRGGYQYHGRVEALANAAHENGLDF